MRAHPDFGSRYAVMLYQVVVPFGGSEEDNPLRTFFNGVNSKRGIDPDGALRKLCVPAVGRTPGGPFRSPSSGCGRRPSGVSIDLNNRRITLNSQGFYLDGTHLPATALFPCALQPERTDSPD